MSDLETNSNKGQTENQDTLEKDRELVREGAEGLWKNVLIFLKKLLDLRSETDRANTVAAIKADIPFRGATAWILICSIFVASVGLNANSTAVVIGAMLISPLMGPILGIGFSIAVNDIDTLRKSLINFGVMVFLSVITAFLFFWLFPLREESSELLARTEPDIRDVLIAFFGGLALIIARTKKGTIATVIFGVAIATALMPPLCTVGYGLAEALKENDKGLGFAGGAMYLFMINSIFIALATYLVLKLLRFPMIRYVNSVKRKRIAQLASFLALLVMVPAGITFYRVLQESNFENAAKNFLEKEMGKFNDSTFLRNNSTYSYNRVTGSSEIQLISAEKKGMTDELYRVLVRTMREYPALKNTYLKKPDSSQRNVFSNQLKYLEALRYSDSLDLLTQTQKILYLEEQLAKLSRIEDDIIPFKELCDEARINYENLDSLSYSVVFRSNLETLDTLNIFTTSWNDSIDPAIIQKDRVRLYNWLKFELKVDTLLLK